MKYYNEEGEEYEMRSHGEALEAANKKTMPQKRAVIKNAYNFIWEVIARIRKKL